MILFLAFILISTVSILGQNKCLTTAEAKKLIESINSPTDSAEKKEIRQDKKEERKKRREEKKAAKKNDE